MERIEQEAKAWAVHVGQRIRATREAVGLTQDELATLLTERGYPTRRATMAKTESAGRPVTLDDLAALATVLDVPVSHFTMAADEAEVRRAELEGLSSRQVLVSLGLGDVEDAARKTRESVDLLFQYTRSQLAALDLKLDLSRYTEPSGTEG